MNVYTVTFKCGPISNETSLVLAEDIVEASEKAEKLREHYEYHDVIGVNFVGEIDEAE